MKRSIGIAVIAVLVAGCYAWQPAAGPAPKNGERLSFEITDMGRVTLGGSMGPEISLVEGRLLDTESDAYVVGVTAVRTIRGGVQVWSGERVRIEKQHVAHLHERRFSPGRTVALSAVFAGGMAILFGKDLAVFGGGNSPLPTKPDTIISLVARP